MLFSRHCVPVTTDTCVFVSATALRRFLAFKHLAVLGDSVPFALGHISIGAGLSLSRSPGKIVTADLDVIVREFTKLVIIHA
jgi:hypothetical protein